MPDVRDSASADGSAIDAPQTTLNGTAPDGTATDSVISEGVNSEGATLDGIPVEHSDLPPFHLPEEPVTLIEPDTGHFGQLARDLWTFRELLAFLTWRDIKIRYKQTALGAAWALLQPLTTMLITAVFFGKLGGLAAKTGGTPYPLFVFAGLLPWTFIANAVQNGGNSLVSNSNLMTKVFFPRLLLPAATVLGGLVDLMISFLLLDIIMGYYGVRPGASVLLLPLLLVLLTLLASGVGALLAGITVRFRDVRYALPLLVQSWMLLSPVIWPPTLVPAAFRPYLALNPMTGILDGFRACLLNKPIPWGELGISTVVTLLLLVFSVRAFRRMEAFFADII